MTNKRLILKNVIAIAICIASFLGANNVLAQTSPNILVDFSTLENASNNAHQQGWNVSGILYEIATVGKYLVLETEGGDNSDGFSGMQFIVQGNDGAAIEVEWTQINLNGDWITFPRAEGNPVSIAIDIANVLNYLYQDFLQCTWARILIGYYNGTTAFEGLGLTGAYLTDDFDKPADAVDLASNYGFIFEGSVLPQAPETVSSPIDFEDFDADYEFAIGKDYFPMPAWGYADDMGGKIIVVEKDDNNVLKVAPQNVDLAAIFKTLNLPAGKTVGDIHSISFNVFWESFKELAEGDEVMDLEVILYLGNPATTLGHGTGFANPDCISFKGNPQSQVGIIGSWFQNTVTLDDILNPEVNIGGSNYSMNGWEEVADLNQITFGIGLNAGYSENGVFYIDDIVFRFNGNIVTFAGEEINIAPQTVDYGSLATKPTDPERENFEFGGWFTDNGTFANQWDFENDVVTQDTTLYAKWIEKTEIADIDIANIKIYPNPVKDELVIDNGELKINNVEIHDLSGKRIVNYQLSTINSINVSNLSQGIYFVKFKTEKGTITKKFVKE